jgi:hypothetical protein
MSDSAPYVKTQTVAATSGQANWLTMDLPPRGTIDSFTISQEDGTLEGYVVDVFDTHGVQLATITLDEEHYKVFATKTATYPSKLITDYALKAPYINRDGSPSNLIYELYVRITPAGTGVKNFAVTMVVQPPLLV